MIVYSHQREPLEAGMADDKQAKLDRIDRKLVEMELGIATLFIVIGVIALGFGIYVWDWAPVLIGLVSIAGGAFAAHATINSVKPKGKPEK